MGKDRLRGKAIYILAWLIIVCSAVLIRINATGGMWRTVYDGIYDTGTDVNDNSGYAGSSRETDVYGYMDYWESQVEYECEVGVEYESPQSDDVSNTESADERAEEEKSSDGEASSDTEVLSDAEVPSDEESSADITDGTTVIAENNPQKNSGEESVKSDAQTDGDSEQKITASQEAVTAMADITDSYLGMDTDTLISYCYNVLNRGSVTDSELDADTLLGKDVSLNMDSPGYKVLIYHSHSSEAFADSRDGETSDTIVGVGEYLADLLTNTYGIPTYHDTSEYDMMSGTLDRDAAYDYSRAGVTSILEQYPDVEVIIDLHRDGLPDDVRLVTEVNGKKTAQIMLVNGMSRDADGVDISYLPNENKIDNMALSLQVYLAARANYSGLMRKIYISSYRYNLDILPHAMLAEVGGQTNTVEEAKNAMEPFAAALAKVLLK